MPAETIPAARARAPIAPQLLDTGVVAILRAARDDRLEAVAVALVESGVTCLELTLTTPGALEALRRLRPLLGEHVALGMGSVIDAAQAQAVVEAGTDFIVSPAVCEDVARRALAAGVSCYPGAFTPTEILTGWRLGASAVKLFPAVSGGPRHLRDIAGPLPGIPLVPTGGVGIDEIGAYLAAGAVAVGLGGPLIGDALEGGSLVALRERARAALGAVAEVRSA